MKKFNGPVIESLLQRQCPQPDSLSIIISDFIWLLLVISILFIIGG